MRIKVTYPLSLIVAAVLGAIGWLLFASREEEPTRAHSDPNRPKPVVHALTGEVLQPYKPEELAALRKKRRTEQLRSIWREQGTSEVEVLICVEDEAVVSQLEQTYPELKRISKTEEVLRYQLPMTLAESFLEALPAGVKWMNETAEAVLLNKVATGSRFLGLNAPLREKDYAPTLDGRGEVVAVIDTGISSGIPGAFHMDLIPALYGMVVEPVTGMGLENNVNPGDLAGHGTHVCGSVVSQGLSYSETRGAAPGAHLFSQCVFSASNGAVFFNKLENHFERSYAVGARVISCSWKHGTKSKFPTTWSGPYTYKNPYTDPDYTEAYAQSVDAFVWNHPETTVCFAVDNSGTDANPKDGVIDLGNVYSYEAYAKNIITVGAQESYRPRGTDSTGPVSTKTYAGYSSEAGLFLLDKKKPAEPYNTYDGMAAFSSRGPLIDGRIAPMLVAPGTDIYSTSQTDGARFDGGTSMATPLVSGTAAVLRQYLKEYQDIAAPTAAVVRAGLILCSETLYPGQYGTGQYLEIPKESPNNVEGWGALRLGKHLTGEARLGFVDRISLETGKTHTFTIPNVVAGTELSVVLSWIDAPGLSETYDRTLVNNYNLTVVAPNNKSYTIDDAKNAIERICIPADEVQSGTYTVIVSGAHIEQPGTGNLAAVAWRAKTTDGAVLLKQETEVSEETVSLTVRAPLNASPYLDFPLYPAPGMMTYPKGTKLRILSAPKLPTFTNSEAVSLCGWYLKKADGTLEKGTESSFDLVLDQDMVLQWYTVFPGYKFLLR